MHYSPFDPYNGHAYVDIGGLKWATMNIGATSETDAGLYFQWGDTQGYTASQVGSGSGQKAFTWADYKFNPSGDGSTMTKYNSTDGKTVLEATDDAVANWGGEWRVPSRQDFIHLFSNTNQTFVENYNGTGVNGYLFTSRSDSTKKLFFPATGTISNGKVSSDVNEGFFWTSALSSENVNIAFDFIFDRSGMDIVDGFTRFEGQPIRPVTGEQTN